MNSASQYLVTNSPELAEGFAAIKNPENLIISIDKWYRLQQWDESERQQVNPEPVETFARSSSTLMKELERHCAV